jgi:hypothetical protein
VCVRPECEARVGVPEVLAQRLDALARIKARRKRRAARRGACGLRPVPALAPQPDERAPWFRASRTQGYRGRCDHTARQRSAAGKPHEVQVARAVALTKSGVEIDVVAVGVAHGRDPMSPWRVERLMGAA